MGSHLRWFALLAMISCSASKLTNDSDLANSLEASEENHFSAEENKLETKTSSSTTTKPFNVEKETFDNSLFKGLPMLQKYSGLNVIEKLREQMKEKEAELENAEKINKSFERMIQLVNILGQVDTFLTDRTRLILKKLSMLADDTEGSKSNKPSYSINF